jgi:hypothetical protein
MGKMACICGNIISDVCGDDAEAFAECQMGSTIDHEDDVYLAGDGRSIMECSECGSLLIEDPPGTSNFKIYCPENKKFNKLFIN